jgi:hypothetical protein
MLGIILVAIQNYNQLIAQFEDFRQQLTILDWRGKVSRGEQITHNLKSKIDSVTLSPFLMDGNFHGKFRTLTRERNAL